MRPPMQTVHQADVERFWNRGVWRMIWQIAAVGQGFRQMGLAGILVGSGAIVCMLRPAQAAELTGWRFDPATQQLEVSVPQGTTPRYFLLAQPARIVLDLPNTQMGAVPVAQTYSGAVRQIRVAQFDPGLTRIVMELSPDAVLAPGQVELQPTQAGAQSSAAQWRLRPLLVGDAAAPDIASRPDITSQSEASIVSDQALPTAAQPTPIAAAPATLPPLEPNAVQIPVEPSPGEVGRSAPTAILPDSPAPVPIQPSVSVPPLQAPMVSDRALPSAPPVSAPIAATPPATSINSAPLLPPETAVAVEPQPILPPAMLPNQQPVTVSVPPLQSPPAPPAQTIAPPASTTPAPAARQSVEFGQPWSAAGARVATDMPLLLASGSVLRLRYPQQTSLDLESGVPRQEVLLLQEAVRDRSGNILFPQGSQVLGRFETDSNGSQFIAQAITLQGRNIRLNAKSDILGGDRHLSERNMIGGSALGALAVGVIGGFTGIGLLGGALAGAATTYLTSPQPATIQPNQIIEVRLLEDLAQSS